MLSAIDTINMANHMKRTEIRVGGLGGQGVILCGYIIGNAASLHQAKHATLIQSFGPEARGSACSTQVTVSDEPIGYPYVKNPDILILMSPDAYNLFVPQLKSGGLVLYENDLVKLDNRIPTGAKALGIPATKFANEVGRRMVLNIVMVGFFAGVNDLLSFPSVEKAVLDLVPKGTEDLNLRALRKGYEYGQELLLKMN